ncbi:MAG: helix-turn-helix transcriptional regulator [Solirubrobacterales bacterium]|nr:helix-turn-helix transcriptional regulator [Solirubrobacterales bacterium]
MDRTSFRPFFRAACVEISQRKGLKPSRVASRVGVADASITRFEKGITFPSENFEAYAAGYASFDGIDPRALVAKAVEQWQALGDAPLTAEEAEGVEEAKGAHDGKRDDPLAIQTIVDHIRRAELAPVPSAAQPSATRRKREGAQ